MTADRTLVAALRRARGAPEGEDTEVTELERLQAALAEIVRLYDKGRLRDVTIDRPAERDPLVASTEFLSAPAATSP